MVILDEMGRGNTVSVVPVQAEFTTQEAADLLNVSRPTLIQLLEAGEIPFHRVGTHRRVSRENLMVYRENRNRQRLAAMAELTAYDQLLGL
jgi:excisionase family DNA binding protein